MKVVKTKIFADVTQETAVVHFTATNVRELSDVQKIISEIEELAYNRKLSLVVVNFSRLRQMTSSFLSKLITLNKSLTQIDVKLHLCCMNPEVERAFRICKLQKVIPLFKTEKKALET